MQCGKYIRNACAYDDDNDDDDHEEKKLAYSSPIDFHRVCKV